MTTLAAPLVFKKETGSSLSVSFPAFSAGDVLIAFVHVAAGNESAISGFTQIAASNSNNFRTISVLARIAQESDENPFSLTNSSRRTTAHCYTVPGANSDLGLISFETTLASGAENPNFNPPALTPPPGEGGYVWFATVSSNVTGGFSSGPTDYTSQLSINDEGANPDMSFGTGYRFLTAATEDPSPFISSNSSSSRTYTIAIPVDSPTTPILRKTGTQTFNKPAGIGTITGVTLNGQAITLDSQDAETFTVTDSDGSITTSGEYDLVATGDTVETVTVQVNVIGVAPANNPMRKDGAALTNLTDVELRISAGATLAGTQLFYTGVATTDESGNLGNIDLSDTAANVDDVVVMVTRTAAGDGMPSDETVGLI